MTSSPRLAEWGPCPDWALTIGRPPPPPTTPGANGQPRLNPAFVEWMMGYPAGWTDDLARTQALKRLGNAVQPQTAAAAIPQLLARLAALPPFG